MSDEFGLEHQQAVAFAKTQEELRFIKEVLGVFDKHDSCDDAWWRVRKDGTIRFLVNCNDLFYWATADAEEVTPADVAALDQAYADCDTAGRNYHGGILFAARKRGMRPQAPYFAYFNDAEVELFKACGPEREDEKSTAIGLYLERRDAGLRDVDQVKVEDERNLGRAYLKRVTKERQLSHEDQRMIQELLGLDHGD